MRPFQKSTRLLSSFEFNVADLLANLRLRQKFFKSFPNKLLPQKNISHGSLKARSGRRTQEVY